MNTKFKTIFILVSLVAAGGLISTGVLWSKLQNRGSVAMGSDTEITNLIKDIGKVLVLPGDETPELLTVSNLDELKGQAFFTNAMVGDKVLVYSKNSKAVLWRPNTKKIIEASVINISPASQ
jgi:hypothetical protein